MTLSFPLPDLHVGVFIVYSFCSHNQQVIVNNAIL